MTCVSETSRAGLQTDISRLLAAQPRERGCLRNWSILAAMLVYGVQIFTRYFTRAIGLALESRVVVIRPRQCWLRQRREGRWRRVFMGCFRQVGGISKIAFMLLLYTAVLLRAVMVPWYNPGGGKVAVCNKCLLEVSPFDKLHCI